ncbi:MAG TPA: hypothetical protein VGM90_34135 [Kofleriaceae bacterium]|jgi:hypothetical protein
MRAWLLVALTASACGRDVQLGSAADAAIPDDVPAESFVPGSYVLALLDTNFNCDGSLSGMESSFAGVTPASQNVVAGVIDLSTVAADTIRLTGVAISSAFNMPTIDLKPDPQSSDPSFPATIWDADISMTFGTGPLTTTQAERFFGIDQATAHDAVMQAAVALLFVTSDQAGACTLSITATLTPQ